MSILDRLIEAGKFIEQAKEALSQGTEGFGAGMNKLDGIREEFENIPGYLRGDHAFPSHYDLRPGDNFSFNHSYGENGFTQGVSLSLGVNDQASVGSLNPILNNGGEKSVTMSFQSGTQHGLTFGVDGKVIGGSFGQNIALNRGYSVTIPFDAYENIYNGEAPLPNIGDASTWPIGAQILLESNLGSEMDGQLAIKNFMAAEGLAQSEGVAGGMTRSTEDELRVYAGGTMAVSEYLSFELGMGKDNLINLGFTGEDQVQDVSLRFTDVDINHPDYNNPMNAMNNLLKGEGMNGSVVNSGQIDILTSSSGTSFGINLGALGQSWDLAENEGRLMVISNDDGTKEVEQFVSFMDGANVINHSSVDANGNVTELGGQVITSVEANSAAAINFARATGQPIIVQPGGILSVQVTPEFMEELSNRYASAHDLHPDIIASASRIANPDGGQLNLGTQNEFLNTVGRSVDGTGELANLTAQIINAEERNTGSSHAFDHLEYKIVDSETGTTLADSSSDDASSSPNNSTEDLNAQLDELQAKLENLDSDIEDYGNDMGSLETEVQELHEDLDEIEEGIENLDSGSETQEQDAEPNNEDSDNNSSDSTTGPNLTSGLIS